MTTLTENADIYLSTTPLEPVFGLGGDDTLTASAGGNLLAGGSGSDRLIGGLGNDTLFGDDTFGGSYANVLNGKGGNDSITSYSGLDQIDAGSGNDTVTIFAALPGEVVQGGGGMDMLVLRSQAGTTQAMTLILGQSFTMLVNGLSIASFVDFESLDVTGGTGGNVFVGGDHADVLTNTLSSIATFKAGSLNGMGGNDALAVFGFTDRAGTVETVVGGLGNDTLSWSNGTAAGRDLVVSGGSGTMKADGTLFLDFSEIETLRFQTGAGYTGTIQYTGIDRVDTVDIYAASSTVKLGNGSDSAVIESGATTVNGGAGNDVLSLGFSNGASYLLAGDAGDDILFSGLAGGTLQGGAGHDTLYGGSSQSTLDGGDGSDLIFSQNAKAHLLCGAGNDTLMFTDIAPGTGNAKGLIDGGAGADEAVLDMTRIGTANVTDFTAASTSLADGTVVQGLESVVLYCGGANDRVTASAGGGGIFANQVYGNAGNDKLTAASKAALLDGGSGDDTLTGGLGGDALTGGLGNDSLTAGDGRDTLTGGAGLDKMTGGTGADSFVFLAPGDTTGSLTTCDRISDFSHADHDKIDISALAGSVAGGAPLKFIGVKDFHGTAGEVRYEQFDLTGTASDHTEVLIDMNGDGLEDAMIDLAGLIGLADGDFVLV
jgi:Ca2+-binding RTX toxin-like protein